MAELIVQERSARNVWPGTFDLKRSMEPALDDMEVISVNANEFVPNREDG